MIIKLLFIFKIYHKKKEYQNQNLIISKLKIFIKQSYNGSMKFLVKIKISIGEKIKIKTILIMMIHIILSQKENIKKQSMPNNHKYHQY